MRLKSIFLNSVIGFTALFLGLGFISAWRFISIQFENPAQPEITVDVPAPADDSLLDAIRLKFQEQNQIIEYIQVLDTKPRLSKYWVLARGIRQDWDFKGSFDDELFGLFVVDEDFKSIEKVVDVFPTRAWTDYDVWIASYSIETVVVRGHRATYGGIEMEKSYEVLREIEKSYDLSLCQRIPNVKTRFFVGKKHEFPIAFGKPKTFSAVFP